MNYTIDKQKALKKWSPILEALNVTDPEKREWIAEYAELHQMNENVSMVTLGNLQGMGSSCSSTTITNTGFCIWC